MEIKVGSLPSAPPILGIYRISQIQNCSILTKLYFFRLGPRKRDVLLIYRSGVDQPTGLESLDFRIGTCSRGIMRTLGIGFFEAFFRGFFGKSSSGITRNGM